MYMEENQSISSKRGHASKHEVPEGAVALAQTFGDPDQDV
jgi:hypothetical protein